MFNDLHPLKQFAILMTSVLLMVGLFVALFWGWVYNPPQESGSLEAAQISQRIRPVAFVVAGSSGAPAAGAAAVEEEKTAAYDGTLDGSVVFDKLCAACHGTGAGGAPTMDHGHWDHRIADRGVETLIQHAIDGYMGDDGFMPARGGNNDLTDEQVAAAVEWMLDNLE